MGWKGILAGSFIGSLLGNPIASLIGAVLGDRVERAIQRGRSANRRPIVFCTSVGSILAKMAKADGHVSAEEIAGVERAFVRLGFSPTARKYAVDAFRAAKDDARSIYDYAREFAAIVSSIGVREFFYELLWELAAADGHISANELVILQRIPRALGIRTEWYAYYYNRYTRAGGAGGGAAQPQDSLADAYQLLGVSPQDSTDALKRRYRELAKKNHPDALRAQGLPEEMIGKATERMSRINSAWATIRSARGM